jgi:tetraacyldisaccharide 4'-kinase
MRAALTRAVQALWQGDGALARGARAALVPAERAYAAVVRRRNAEYDAGRRTAIAAVPAVSVGNVTVGGTGKTPVAGWFTDRLQAAGARPAIVLRGYGDDEWREHALAHPGVPVVVDRDRVAGMRSARGRGADCAVLDDAFQHRRAARVSDVVLLSADQWTGRPRLLPTGPFREPLSALRRATEVVVTRKGASRDQADRVWEAVHLVAPGVPVAVVELALGDVVLASPPSAPESAASPSRHPSTWLAGRDLVVASGIGDPAAFALQLERAGARLRARHRFPDHHHYTTSDVSRLLRAADGGDGVCCTLKDAVKLAPLWPRGAPPLWYVSLAVVVERGAEALDRAVARVLAARAASAPPAG